MRKCPQPGHGTTRPPVLVRAGGLIHARDRGELARAKKISGGRFSLLISSSHIRNRTKDLARDIVRAARIRRHAEIHLLIVLKGAAFFGCRLAQEIFYAGWPRVCIHFVSVSSYGRKAYSSGRCRIAGKLNALRGKDVIVVEDIYDTGLTLQRLKNHLLNKVQAASVKACVLLDKQGGRKKQFQKPGLMIHAGFQIPTVFVAGGGMDYDDKFRELPFIVAVRDQAAGALNGGAEADRMHINHCP